MATAKKKQEEVEDMTGSSDIDDDMAACSPLTEASLDFTSLKSVWNNSGRGYAQGF